MQYEYQRLPQSQDGGQLRRERRERRLIVVAMLVATAVLVWLVNLSTQQLQPSSVDKPPLRVKPAGTFHLSVFVDLHYGENESTFGIGQDINSTALIGQVLDQESPDLNILNGDLITGENTFAFNSSLYLDKIVVPIVQRNQTWASTYGNHDTKFNLSREGIFQREQLYANSYTQHGPSGTDGVTNYMLPIYGCGANTSSTPLALLWFFDSRGGCTLEDNTDNVPNYVSDGTVQWYRAAQADAQNRWGVLPSLAFVHIPMLAFYDLQQNANVSGPQYPGLNQDVPLAQQGYSGTGNESVPFMQALLDTPGLHSVYSGHDHGDSWCGRWPNTTLPGDTASRPFLCFCKHSGYGGYGSWPRGIRQVELSFGDDGMEVQTWVRMADGQVITNVSLNATYGYDTYSTYDGGDGDGD